MLTSDLLAARVKFSVATVVHSVEKEERADSVAVVATSVEKEEMMLPEVASEVETNLDPSTATTLREVVREEVVRVDALLEVMAPSD